MAILHALAQSVGFIEFLFRRRDASGDIYPTDAVAGVVDGPRPLGLLVVGEGTAMGLGVATHALAPAAQTARRLARITQRGVSWSALGFPDARMRSAGALTADASNFAGVDVVIVMAGIVDTLCMTPVAQWKQQLGSLLDDLDSVLAPHSRVIVAQIPPMDNAGSISRGARLAAGLHARRLNAATRTVVAGRADAEVTAFPSELTDDLWVPKSEQGLYRRLYAVWADAFSQSITAHVGDTAARPDERRIV
jgi:hypothetical protein